MQECEGNYTELLNTNGIVSENTDLNKEMSGKIDFIAPIVLEGTTHYYVGLENSEDIFDLNMANNDLIGILKYQVGDDITFSYTEGYGLHQVKAIVTGKPKG